MSEVTVKSCPAKWPIMLDPERGTTGEIQCAGLEGHEGNHTARSYRGGPVSFSDESAQRERIDFASAEVGRTVQAAARAIAMLIAASAKR
jgi:hypothetical protein